MTLKQYLVSMFLGTVLSWFAWLMVLNFFNPFTSSISGFILFYLTLFLSLVGTFSVVGFSIRAWIIKEDEIIFRKVKKTFRQAILFSILICCVLILQSQRMLKLWTLIPFIFIIVFTEFFLTSYKRSPVRG